tara:strand:+ start:265 stop:510 length:246 start_codon:yes stop_codon:yes gene_type:complete
MNQDFIIQCEEIYLDDMKRLQKDKLLAEDIIRNDILNAKLKDITYEEFKKVYRPVGDDSAIKKLWMTMETHHQDDWIIILS